MVSAPAAPPNDPTTLWLPTLQKSVPRPWFLPSAETLAEQRRIMEGTYFLCRIKGNSGIGEALICDPKKGGCGGKHDYMTLRCVPRPYSGITGGLFAYYRAVVDNGLGQALSATEQARTDGIANVLGRMPDIAAAHPQLARSMTAGLGQNDAQIAAVALGVLEAIPPSLARKYRDRINTRGIRPRFDLPGMEP